MMWYDKYNRIYNHPASEVSTEILKEIGDGYRRVHSAEPLVSVIAIAHNEGERILSCIWSLVDNVCRYPVELLIVDDDSEDGMSEMLSTIGIQTIFEKRRSPGYARQAGLDRAKGKYCVAWMPTPSIPRITLRRWWKPYCPISIHVLTDYGASFQTKKSVRYN